MSEAETGITVRLKSGGPIMTIRDEEDADQEVECDWFTNSGEHRHAPFKLDQLDIVDVA